MVELEIETTATTLLARLQAGLPVDRDDLILVLTDARLLARRSIDEKGQEAAEREAIRTRDNALRSAAACLSGRGKGRPLARMIQAYRSGRWQKDKLSVRCPADINGKVEGFIWLALKAGEENIPQGHVRLLEIIRN